MKNRAITKIISCVLCAAISMQIGLALTVERVNGDSYSSDRYTIWSSDKLYYIISGSDDSLADDERVEICSPTANDSLVLNGTQLQVFDSASGTLGAFITKEDGTEHTLSWEASNATINSITMSNSSDEIDQWSGHLYCSSVTNNGEHRLYGLGDGCGFSCSGTYTNNGTVIIGEKGTFSCGTLSGSGTISVNSEDATLTAETITINSGSTNSGTVNVSSSLSFSGYSTSSAALGGIFVCSEEALVSSDGATFTLKVGDYQKEISGVIDGKNAYDLVRNDPKVKLGNIPDTIYYGQEYDFTNLITTDDGYKGEVYLQYLDGIQNGYVSKPVNPSSYSYSVRAVAEAYGSYREAHTEWQDFQIKYLPFPDAYCTLSGIVDGKYVADKLIITPPEGYQIICSHDRESYVEVGDIFEYNFQDYVSIDEDENEVGSGKINQDLMVRFKSVSGDTKGFITDDISLYSVLSEADNALLDKLVFETEGPYFEAYTYDPEDPEESYSETSVSGDDVEISAPAVEVDVYDANLSSVKLVVNDKETDLSNTIQRVDMAVVDDMEDLNTDALCEITIESEVGTAKKVKIIAADAAGHESTASFTLYPTELSDTTLTAKLPKTIHVGDEYAPEIETNSDAEPVVEYYPVTDTDAVTETPPTSAGTYHMTVTVEKTKLFKEKSYETNFEIVKKDVEDEFTFDEINPIIVGGTPVINYDVGDYDGTYTTRFLNASNSEVSSFTAAGDYIFEIDFPETATFLPKTIALAFEVKDKSDFTPVVTVADITVGSTPVVTVTDVPDDYDGEYKITYLNEEGEEPEDFTVSGTYTAVVTFPETAIYIDKKVTKPFDVNKLDVTATITVSDIYVGGTPDPEVKITTGYDGDYSISYRDGDGEATTTFTTVGTYLIVVSILGNDKYYENEIVQEFEVKEKEPVTATVSVADIFVDGDVSPVLTVDPESYNGTPKYEYKLSSEEDEAAYSTTVPTAAGEYTVRVTLPETAVYAGTTCTDTFEISKIEIEEENIAVTVKNIKVGQTPAPSVTGLPEDYDGEIAFVYIDGNGNSFSTEPLPAGNYLVRATIPETEKYERAICETDLEVRKNELTEAKVTVESIKVGQIPEPLVTGLPEDYDGEITIVYIDGNGDSCSAESLAANNYLVRATISETDKYERAICETDLEVDKNDLTATVSVADIMVGGDVVPVLSVDADDYNGEVEYTYKSSTATTYSETVPTDAGTYTVMARLLETDKYWGTECTSEFTISKNTISATVSVADIFVGGEVKPVVTTDPEGYNGTITYVYKLSAADDSAYSATVPSAAGTYTVKATLSSTEAFLGTTCTNTFTISKNAVTATVSVANITVGNKPAPVVTSLSKGTATFEYKLSSEGDTAYSEEVPTAAGEYTVRATIAETATYLSTTCTGTFTISKNELKASVSVADIKVGGTVKPVLTVDAEDYNGEVSYEYKSSTANTFSTEVPTAAGTYTVRATLAATDKYLGTTCTGTFTITKNELKASVSVADITVGGTVKPVLTVDAEDYDGKVTYEYKSSTATAYSTTVPAAAGTYTVRATLAATDKYLGTTCTADFTISKNTLSATVSVADITFGNTPKPVVTTDPADYDGAISYEYKLSTADDSAYSVTVPSDAGTYTVRATLSSTVNYLGTICTADFKIIKKTVTATVSVADITVGNTPKPVVTTESNGKDKAEFYYKLSSADESAYSKTIPTAAGTYTVKAVIPEMDNYFGVTCTGNFTISLNKVKVMELSVPDILYGQTVKTSFKTDSNGEITIKFKAADAADSTYSITPPTKVGKYTAMASVGETNTFEAASITVNFSISYLDAPGTPYIPSGTSGNNGYYTSDVVLNAPAGYLISASEGGPFSASIPYSDSLTNVYLKRTSDNALTAGIAVSKNIKIDKEAPSISSSSGVLSGGAVLYLESLTLTISDANLASLIVNGSTVTLSSSGSTVLTLTRPENGAKKYRIVAEDEAGNITVIEFTLKAEWLEDKVIPEGTPVSLVAGEAYYLDEGTWIVSKVNSDGTITEGTTVFSGNIPFYVAVDGEYIFTRVT